MKRIVLIFTAVVLFIVPTLAGQGIYVEYKMTATEKSNFTGNIKTYTVDGNSRSEMSMAIPNMPGGGMDMVSLFLSDKPDTMYMLNVKDKTYSATATNQTKDAKKTDTEYQVTVIGKEKVNGYNSTHVKLLNKKTNTTMDMWTSQDIADYGDYKSARNKYLDGNNLYKALQSAGADGFPVRIVSNEQRGGQMQMDLVKAEKRNVDSSMFSLDGYTRTASVMPGGADRQEMIKKIQAMTPEERQKYMEEMKKQYQRPKN